MRQLPALRRLRDRALDSLSRGRRPLDFETQVRPWIGDEAAVALLREGRRATSLILVRVADQPVARRFLEGAGELDSERHRGVTRARVRRPRGRVRGQVPRGRQPAQRARRDRRAAPATRWRGTTLFRRAVDKLEVDDPLAYAYAPARGIDAGGARRSAG